MVTPSWRIILGGSSKHFMALVKICSFFVLHSFTLYALSAHFICFSSIWRYGTRVAMAVPVVALFAGGEQKAELALVQK